MNENEQKSKGWIIAISGPSGVGKGTIVKRLLQEKLPNLYLSVSVTTRKKRADEVDGREYYFFSREEFEQKVKNNEFIEWVEYNGSYYGTLKKALQDMIDERKNVLVEIDYRGVDSLKQIFGSKNIFSIFVLPPSLEELKARLVERSSESAVSINQRTLIAQQELLHSQDYDLKIINDDLDRCCNELLEVFAKKLYLVSAKN